MELITIESFNCSSCGASVDVNKITRKTLCEHCNTVFSLHICEQAEAEFYIKKASTALKIKKYDDAKVSFEQAIMLVSNDWRSWFGIVQCYTKNFTIFETEHLVALKESKKLASDNTLAEIEKEYADYAKQLELQQKRDQHVHVMASYSTKGLFSYIAKAMNAIIPTCPFCTKDSDWHTREDDNKFYKCPNCLAEIMVATTFFTHKVKTIDIVDVGIINNDFSVGSIDPKLIVSNPKKLK